MNKIYRSGIRYTKNKKGLVFMEEVKRYRHEYKYICTNQQLTLIQSRINNLLQQHIHL